MDFLEPYRFPDKMQLFNARRFLTAFSLIAMPLAFSACSFWSTSEEGKGQPVARVGDQYLYKSDLNGLIVGRTTPQDSANIISRYVDTWIKKQLLLKAAAEEVNIDELEIQRKLEEYRYQLIAYEFEKKVVEASLNGQVTEEEIKAFYEQNIDNFLLKQNIVKGIFLKVSKDAPRLDMVRPWMLSNNPEDMEKLRSYTLSFAEKYILEDTSWIDFDEYIYNTPFTNEIINPVQTLQREKYLSTSDSAYRYHILIKEYKIIDQVSPLEFVKGQVRDILINKRILDIKRKLEKDLYDKALENNEYEIY